jgi:hypothetical protein
LMRFIRQSSCVFASHTYVEFPMTNGATRREQGISGEATRRGGVMR